MWYFFLEHCLTSQIKDTLIEKGIAEVRYILRTETDMSFTVKAFFCIRKKVELPTFVNMEDVLSK